MHRLCLAPSHLANSAVSLLKLAGVSPLPGTPSSRQHVRANRATRTVHQGWPSLQRKSCAMAMHAALSKAGAAAAEEGVSGFADRSTEEFTISILGDLHLEPAQMDQFHEARTQLRDLVSRAGMLRSGSRVVQLGDLGGYDHQPGSRDCFLVAHEYLEGFGMPLALVLGNHDLEGAEFETDEENLAVWQQVFGQRHYWSADVGPATFVGMSTTRFRSNLDSVHEVFISAEQVAWFRTLLAARPERPVVVFTHAPPMGSGLKVVQDVHVKNRCAWLNQSEDPAQFLRLVNQHPQIKLWFSGHFHLSQNYADSISIVGSCAFVQTSVIGDCHRDGIRQSRVLKGNAEGYEVYSIDHDIGELRLDLAHGWTVVGCPRPLLHPNQLLGDRQAGWPASQMDYTSTASSPAADAESAPASAWPRPRAWWAVGPDVLLSLKGKLLVQYDAATRSPVGLVCLDVAPSEQVVLVDAQGRRVCESPDDDGAGAVAVELWDKAAGASRRIERHKGGFFQIFQKNKWRARKQREREAALAAAAH